MVHTSMQITWPWPPVVRFSHDLTVEDHVNENPLNILKQIAYVGQRLMYPIITKNKIPYHASFVLNAIMFSGFYIKNSSF